MGERKELGKIKKAEFGLHPSYPFMLGLQLTFEGKGWGVGCGGRYTVNISDECKWDSPEHKQKAFDTAFAHLVSILEDAKVNNVSELIGKPVEIILDSNTFKSFRVLTEVL